MRGLRVGEGQDARIQRFPLSFHGELKISKAQNKFLVLKGI